VDKNERGMECMKNRGDELWRFAPKNFDFQEGKELSLPGKFAPGNFWNFSSCEQKWNFHFLELLLSMQPAN